MITRKVCFVNMVTHREEAPGRNKRQLSGKDVSEHGSPTAGYANSLQRAREEIF